MEFANQLMAEGVKAFTASVLITLAEQETAPKAVMVGVIRKTVSVLVALQFSELVAVTV